MGLITSQYIRGFHFIYIGAILGIVNRGYLLPELLRPEQLGMLDVILSYSVIISRIAILGFNATTYRLFPYFRDKEKKHNGFFFLSLMVGFVGFALSLITYFILKANLFGSTTGEDYLLSNYFNLLIILLFSTIFVQLFDSYNSVNYDSVSGIFGSEVLQRLFIFIFLIFFWFDYYSFHYFAYSYFCSFLAPLIFIVIQIYRNGNFFLKPNLKFINKPLRRELISVSSFSLISSVSSVLILNIDRVMLERMLTLNETGIYTTAFFYSSILLMVFRPMNKISNAVIAESWKNSDLKHISSIYKKSVTNLSILGFFIFGALVINLDNLYTILPKYAEGRYVVIIVGIAFMTDLLTGVNTSIIQTSHKYMWKTYFLILLAILVIILNLILIPIYGIIGAALSVLISKIVINTISHFLSYLSFGFQPYALSTLILIAVFLISFVAAYYIPRFPNIVVDFGVRTSVFTVLLSLMVYFLKLSEEANKLINKYLSYLKKN